MARLRSVQSWFQQNQKQSAHITMKTILTVGPDSFAIRVSRITQQQYA